jgi:hypothetical protein
LRNAPDVFEEIFEIFLALLFSPLLSKPAVEKRSEGREPMQCASFEMRMRGHVISKD